MGSLENKRPDVECVSGGDDVPLLTIRRVVDAASSIPTEGPWYDLFWAAWQVVHNSIENDGKPDVGTDIDALWQAVDHFTGPPLQGERPDTAPPKEVMPRHFRTAKPGAKGQTRGHAVRYDEQTEVWRYVDDDAPTDGYGGVERPCVKCGLLAESDGPDPCLGRLPDGVTSACCGHGVETGYIVWEGVAHEEVMPDDTRVTRPSGTQPDVNGAPSVEPPTATMQDLRNLLFDAINDYSEASRAIGKTDALALNDDRRIQAHLRHHDAFLVVEDMALKFLAAHTEGQIVEQFVEDVFARHTSRNDMVPWILTRCKALSQAFREAHTTKGPTLDEILGWLWRESEWWWSAGDRTGECNTRRFQTNLIWERLTKWRDTGTEPKHGR